MKQDSYGTSASLLARVSDDTQSQGGATKHTPGPWFAESTAHGVHHISSREGGYGDLATAWNNGEANARLIAAAPEMLEALKKACPHEDQLLHGANVSIRAEAYKAMCAAIAKAEGRS